LKDCVEQEDAGEIICVLDALDECEKRKEMIDALVQYYAEPKRQSRSLSRLKFLITSRPYDDLEEGFKNISKLGTYMHFGGDDKSDAISTEINLVIDAKLQQIAGSFSNEDREQISNRLKSKDNHRNQNRHH
jgi:hypothetical protein